MRTIFIDSENKCHTADDGTMTAIETDFFDGKCNSFVEGYCYEIKESIGMFYPWKPYSELDAAQRQYEREQIAEYEKALAEIEAALGVSV